MSLLRQGRLLDTLHREVGEIQRDRAKDNVDLAEWRGQQSELTHATVRRLGETKAEMTQSFARLEGLIREGFSAQAHRLDRVEEQVRTTNGSVARTIERVASLEASDQADIRADGKLEHFRERTEDRGDSQRQYSLARLIGTATAVAGITGSVCAVLALILH